MSTSYCIKFEGPLHEYLKKKNKDTVTLTVKTSGGGCCPTFEMADIDLRIPEDAAGYNRFDVSGTTVYVSKNARVITPVLQLKLEKSMIGSKIVPIGLSLRDPR